MLSTNTAATGQLKGLLQAYTKLLPMWSFPYVPLTIAAIFQSFAWLSGPIFLSRFTLYPRIMILWLFALGEYLFMSPTMNAGVEVLGLSEPWLVVVYSVLTLIVFMFMNIFVFKKPFEMKYVISFFLLSCSLYVTFMW